MRPHPEHERLNDQLHKHLARWPGNEQSDQPDTPFLLTEKDHEVDRLVALAYHLQAAPPLQVNPDFARQLEQRMLLHHLALGHQSSGRAWQTTKLRGSWFFSRPFVAYISMAVVLLCLLLGTGMFALAAHVTNPGNPLYAVKQWEHQVQLFLAHSPSDKAKVSLPITHDRLNSNVKNNRNNKKGTNDDMSINNNRHRANANKHDRTSRNDEAASNENNSHEHENDQNQRSR
jgi:hypothetical protein